MLSSSDIEIVEQVLSMSPVELGKFISQLKTGTLEYLNNIINQYEKQLD
jgi:hypothetical protein